MSKFANTPLDAPTINVATTDGQPTAWHWSLIAILSLLWGSSFILMKFGLVGFSFTEVASWRIFFAFLVLSLFWVRIPFRSITPTDWSGFITVAKADSCTKPRV